MKKSVNGKSFDEIFGQRGKKVEFADMVKGVIYFCPKRDGFWGSIFEVAPKNYRTFSNGVIQCVNILVENEVLSDYCLHETSGAEHYEATKDQIDLLNAYKNDQP